MIKFKDVAHFYLGCKMQDNESLVTGRLTAVYNDISIAVNDEVDYYPFEYKPLLRPLSDITDEEKREVYKLIFNREFPKTGQIYWRADQSLTAEPRWILMTGVDRVGIEMNGTVWADCDLHHYKHNQHAITTYLLSMHFDLFGLIESGEAVELTILKPSKV